jgi:hypothetical protein
MNLPSTIVRSHLCLVEDDVVLVDGRKDVECIPQELPSLHTSLISAGLVLIKPASFPKQFKAAFPGNL